LNSVCCSAFFLLNSLCLYCSVYSRFYATTTR
jgi:hypothetical protein